MISKDLLSSANHLINLKKITQESIQKQKVQIEVCFKRKDLKMRKFYLNQRKSIYDQFKFQTINKMYLKFAEKLNFKIRLSQLHYHIKNKKKIVKALKYKIIGGGCQSSKQIYNPQQIHFTEKNVDIDDEFQQKFEKFINKMNIYKEIESENQGVAQADIIKFLKHHEIRIRRNIIIYKSKVIELIDVYLIYALTGSSQKEVLNQEEFQKIGQKLQKMQEYFEQESHQNPTYDLIFYFNILERFNPTQIGKDLQNKTKLIQVVEFITTIVKHGSGALKSFEGSFKERFDEILKGVRSLLNTYQQSKANQLFTYLLDIWVKKIDQFQDRIFNLTLLEEIQLYIKIFNELCSQKDYETDLVIFTLIKIDHYFSQAVKDQDNLKTLSQELSLNYDLIKIFLQILIQKSDSQSFIDEMKSFLKFTVENHTYRFLTISILLKYNKIIENAYDSSDYKEQIMEYLCYKYLCEKDKSVKLAFETNKDFVDHFNSKIEKEEFKDKIIKLSNERSKILKIFNLEKYEEKIENTQDIERMIANRIIEKWERDVKRRQEDNISQKDDILLEVRDFYIEQSISFLEGNTILQPKQLQTKINEKTQLYQRSNALQEILNNFLQGSVQTQDNKNVYLLSTEGQNRCKILGILAEGGTGKSMLIKKLETHLIQIANSNSEKENYIPLLIKCNSLDPKKPSVEKYLLEQGVNHQQIKSIKKSDRNKVILLDGYDEFTGEYFRVYSQLNLNEWKNTKVIVTSRKEKLEMSDACFKFSLDGENGLRDETSFCIVKLEEFTHENILEYCKMYFRYYRTKEEKCDEPQYKMDLDVMIDCMKNPQLENLLYLPINLYLFTRMIVQVKDQTEVQKIKENISDQIEIQEIFFKETQKKKDKDLEQLIINSFFEYFQSISMKMFFNKGKAEITNFLQIRKDQIKFKLSNQTENKLSEKQKNILHEKIIHYVNSKIITRSKEEITIVNTNSMKNKSYVIEFKHKSLFEYFAARAMKYDFDVYGDYIYNLNIEQLEVFNINQKCIMNAGNNQSEQQILIKLYKMIKNEIESNEFYSNYHQEQIDQNSRYIQYIKRSTIKKNTEISQIDVGASNMLSVLFFSQYSYSKLSLNFCSFSQLYVSTKKSELINFSYCNLENSYLKNFHINYDSCNIQFATFNSYQEIFSTKNIFSFNQVIWDKKNILYTITNSGFINSFKVLNSNIVLQKSKQLSQTPLSQILTNNNDTLLVSSQYSILLINSISFDLLQSYKFKNKICSITPVKEKILVTFENDDIFEGSFQNGFRKMNMIGSGCVYNESKQILLIYQKNSDIFSLYNIEDNFKLINTIKGDSPSVNVAFSADGKYLAITAYNRTCKIWNVEKGFELTNTIQGHSDYLVFVVFSADGKYLATGSKDNTCKIWYAEKSFELIYTIQNHSREVNSVAFSADGKYLATGSKDGTCKIWNAEKSFEFNNKIQDHTSTINSVAISADGKYFATGSQDNTCKIWNVEKGFELINTILGHSDYVQSVAFSADGKYLATGSKDNTCKIWNAEKSFELIYTIQSHSNFVNSVAFSANGKYLATGSSDKTCKIWNAEKDFELINTVQGHGYGEDVYSVAFSSNGKYLATSTSSTCKIWNAEKNFELINEIDCHKDSVLSIAFSADGKYLATGSKDQTCKIWNAEKGFELIHTIQGQSFIQDFVESVAFSSDGKYLATGTSSESCKIWNVDKGFELINVIQGSVKSVVFSPDGKYLSTVKNYFQVWNVGKAFELINTIQGHTESVYSVAFSADGKFLASGSRDNTVKIWNAQKGFKLINTIEGHTKWVYSVAFSADGKYLATGSSDNTIKIWSAQKGFELINTIQGHTEWVKSVAFSADGKYLATGSQDYTCKIWNSEKGFELINTIYVNSWLVNSVAFSADGKYLATGTRDCICNIWNAEKDFELINTIQGHSYSVDSVVFSADGKYLATGSEDGTCKIQNAEKSFELIYTIQSHSNFVNSVAFSADGKYLSTVSNDKTCQIWNVEQGFQRINIIEGNRDEVYSVAFSADGKYISTGSRDNTCRIWNVEKGLELINATNSILCHSNYVNFVAFSADGKYICVFFNDKSYSIYDLQNLKIISERNIYEKLMEKYQFEQNENNLRIFENMFIL